MQAGKPAGRALGAWIRFEPGPTAARF